MFQLNKAMNKPLIRWTIGPVSDNGFECLNYSYKKIFEIYGDYFDYLVCYNNLDARQIKKLPRIKQTDQKKLKKEINIEFPKKNPAWKLYAPRFNLNGYEILLDNDIVIYKDIFSNLLNKENIFVTEAISRSYSKKYENLIPKNFNINSGFLCLPPNFDFQEEISKEIINLKINKWENFFDEQSLVAIILSKQNARIISLKDIFVCYSEMREANYGLHFVGLNANNHKFWDKYKNLKKYL